MSAGAVLMAVFVIATCGLTYELIAGTLASYVLGDSVTQFSTIIGVYLFAMGVGAWLSRFLDRGIVARFIEIEIGVALLGGASAALLFLSFAHLSFFRIVLYGLVLLIGILVGLEIPLLMRILEDRYDLKDLVSRVLAVDYLGALLASLAFPMFIVPKLGLVRGSLVMGCINGGVALWSTSLFAGSISRPRQRFFLRLEAFACLILLFVGLVYSNELTTLAEDHLFSDPVIFSKSTLYQRVVITRGSEGFQLYLNGNLQFASVDEHRYHEALVHPVMAAARGLARKWTGRGPKTVLILGGGDGLAVREVLRHPGVESVTLVDLDPAMTQLGKEFPLLVDQNQGALLDPRVRIVNEDAMVWLEAEGRQSGAETWGAIIVDFPDPNSYTLGKLYTTRFYRLVSRVLSPDGALVVQSTSPLLARRSFWCVAETLEESGFFVRSYHASVPSFGEWGYHLAARREFDAETDLPKAPLKFLNADTVRAMFVFSEDMARVETDVNRLNNQILVQYYEAEWSRL